MAKQGVITKITVINSPGFGAWFVSLFCVLTLGLAIGVADQVGTGFYHAKLYEDLIAELQDALDPIPVLENTRYSLLTAANKEKIDMAVGIGELLGRDEIERAGHWAKDPALVTIAEIQDLSAILANLATISNERKRLVNQRNELLAQRQSIANSYLGLKRGLAQVLELSEEINTLDALVLEKEKVEALPIEFFQQGVLSGLPQLGSVPDQLPDLTSLASHLAAEKGKRVLSELQKPGSTRDSKLKAIAHEASLLRASFAEFSAKEKQLESERQENREEYNKQRKNARTMVRAIIDELARPRLAQYTQEIYAYFRRFTARLGLQLPSLVREEAVV